MLQQDTGHRLWDYNAEKGTHQTGRSSRYVRSLSHISLVLINADVLFDLNSWVKLKGAFFFFFLISNLQHHQEHLLQFRLLAKIFKCVISWTQKKSNNHEIVYLQQQMTVNQKAPLQAFSRTVHLFCCTLSNNFSALYISSQLLSLELSSVNPPTQE